MAAIISASVRVEECRSMVTGLYSPSSGYECLFGRRLSRQWHCRLESLENRK
jgi:hypothetical protein